MGVKALMLANKESLEVFKKALMTTDEETSIKDR